MNWDDVRIFLAVARSGQLLAAARALGVNHTTVARRLTALENQFNSKLVTRRTTGTELTEAGEHLLARAERIEAEMLQAQASLGNQDIVLSGTVRVATPDGFGVSFLAAQLSEFSLKYPSLTIQLIPVPRLFSLSRREADIAITVERPTQGRLIARKLVDYRLGLYAHKDYLIKFGLPESSQDLVQRHRLIGYVDDLVASPALAYTDEISKDWHSAFQISSALGQLEAVRAKAGIGILHGYIAEQFSELVAVLPDIKIERSYWLSYHETLRGIRRVHEVAAFISASTERYRARFL